MKLSANDIVLKLLGLLLLAASVLKGYELLTEPVANTDIWSNRYLLIFTVEFELALAIWLLSSIFKKLAWLAATACFSLFCCVTIYKALAGYDSCGCFGKVHVNPWITLLVVDLPVLSILFIVKPEIICNITTTGTSNIYRSLIAGDKSVFLPGNLSGRLMFTVSFAILLIITSSIALAVNEPAIATSTYEVLEPETWIGKELPILEHIDIADKIKTGNWLLLFYHHDCPDCQNAIVEYEKMARGLVGNEDFMQIVLVEVPPYGHAPIGEKSLCIIGKMDESKEWFATTPATLILKDGRVVRSLMQEILNLNDLLAQKGGVYDEMKY